jgi:hypothetical protein
MPHHASVRDSHGAEQAAANEVNFRLNLSGPLDFANEALLLDVELHLLTWLQWIVESDPEAMTRQITYHYRAVNWLVALSNKRLNYRFGDAENISPSELAIDFRVGGWIAGFAVTFAVRG